jgi:hypothetical protein
MSLCSAVLHQRYALLLSGFLLLSVLLAASPRCQPPSLDGTLGTMVTQRGAVCDMTGSTQPGSGRHMIFC